MKTPAEEGVYIVGVGARTPVGLNAGSTAAAVRAGVSVMGHHSFMLDKTAMPMVVCADAVLAADVALTDRLAQFTSSAAKEALTALAGRRVRPSISVFIGLPEKRPGLHPELQRTLANRLAPAIGSEVDIRELSFCSDGHAAGLLCIEQAFAHIAAGKSDMCLVGGVDSYLDPETLEWLDSRDQLHSESTIWGFCPGEGAGFVLIASARAAFALDLSSCVQLVSTGSGIEANTIGTESVCVGHGLSIAFQKALAALPDRSVVTHTICDMNGDPYRANEYGFAMLRSPRRFEDEADFATPADCWGDVGAASGPLFAVLATEAARKRYGPQPLTLLWASSEGGLRAAALLRACQ